MISEYENAKTELLMARNPSCRKFFEKNKDFLELGYFYFLNDNLKKAKDCFDKVLDTDIRAHWAKFLIELIENNISYYPSYFELRNFLEIDLDILIKHFKGEYVEKIVNYSDFMSSINPEVNKFIGRVFINNNFKEYGMIYFKRAKNTFYNDPELHFLLAQEYDTEGKLDYAINSAETCLKVLPKYYPAEHLLVELKDKLKNCK
ncbi:MAG: hypothetical protein LKG27_03260 [Clostridiaceae bacterium]|jgi:tetratricopeptide (TPR) repeat protein|nr:hypothetical protein [Clostridiaceae bacterium]